MPGSTDRKYPFQTEVPKRVRIDERVNETSGSGVHVDADFPALLGIQLIQGVIDLLHVIVQSGDRHSLDRHHANGVLVTSLYHILRVQRDLVHRHGNHTHFHVPVDRELLPNHLHTG